MVSYSSILNETLNITGPIFSIVLLGWFLARIGWLSSQFVSTASNLIFTLFLPLLIFNAIINMDVVNDMDWTIVLYSWLLTCICFGVAWLFIRKSNAPNADKGVFVQGAFRSNLGIVGIALCFNSYGNDGAGQAALLLATVTPLFNIFSVIVLSHYQNDHKTVNIKELLKTIIKNPLIISIALALPLSVIGFQFPKWLASSVDSISDMTLPLALLCIGGSLNLKALRQSSILSGWSCLLKLIVFPSLAALGAILMGFETLTVGIIFLMFASPTAAASFVMAKAMKGNAVMAANIIALTTVLSAFTVSLGLFVLKSLELAL